MIDYNKQQPSAPEHETIPSQAKTGKRQVTVPQMPFYDYLPSTGKKPLVLNLKESDLFLTDQCQLEIKEANQLTLTLCCVKDHICEKSRRSFKVMFRELGCQPKEPSMYIHLRMIHQVNLHFVNLSRKTNITFKGSFFSENYKTVC